MNVTLFGISFFVDIIKDLKMTFILNLGWALNPITGVLIRVRRFETQRDSGETERWVL